MIKRIKLVKAIKGFYFLWLTTKRNKDYCIMWEVDFKNLWWMPKIIRETKIIHIGWLFFQVGFGWK